MENFIADLPPIDLKNKLASQEKVNSKNEVYKTFKVQTPVGGKLKADTVAFFSPQHGAGSSELAFNSALNLAKNHKVLYITSELYSSTFYEYQLAVNNKKLVRLTDLDKFKSKIITLNDLKKKHNSKSFMKENIKQFPKDLDYLQITPEFQTALVRLAMSDLKAVLKNSMDYIQSEYDIVIFDCENNLHSVISQLILNYAGKLFLVFNQNIVHLETIGNLNEFLVQKMPDKKVYNILNQYNNKTIKEIQPAYIKDLIDKNIDLIIDQDTKLYWNAAFNGLPPLYYDLSKKTQNNIDNISHLIL